jgi:conjugal transfer pilus assembly protein TraB
MANLNNLVKKKQYLLVGGLMAAIVGGSMLVVFIKNNSESYSAPVKEKDEFVVERYSGIGSNVDEDEVWRATSSNEIDDLKTKNESLVNEMKTMRSGITTEIREAVSEKAKTIQAKLDEDRRKERQKARIEEEKSQKKALRAESAKAARDALLAQQASIAEPVQQTPSNEIHVTRRAFQRTNPNMDNPKLGDYKGEDLVKERESRLHSLSFGVQEISTARELVKLNRVHQEEAVEEVRVGLSAKDYVPSGTFVRALLLGGIDAPTGGQAQEDPYPVLLEVTDFAKLPNSFEYDFRRCRVIGSGYGDISSERAIIRLEKMSCVTEDELVFETRIKGFV